MAVIEEPFYQFKGGENNNNNPRSGVVAKGILWVVFNRALSYRILCHYIGEMY